MEFYVRLFSKLFRILILLELIGFLDVTLSKHLTKNSVQHPTTTEPYDKGTRFIELALVVDYDLYKNVNSDFEQLTEHYRKMRNQVSGHLQPFLWVASGILENCQRGNPVFLYDDLQKCLYYTGNFLNASDDVILITTCAVDNKYVGIMCMCNSSRVNANQDLSLQYNATYGARNLTLLPPEGRFENPEWSNCSKESLKLITADRKSSTCLNNKPRSFDGPICEKGFIKSPEKCDCGPTCSYGAVAICPSYGKDDVVCDTEGGRCQCNQAISSKCSCPNHLLILIVLIAIALLLLFILLGVVIRRRRSSRHQNHSAVVNPYSSCRIDDLVLPPPQDAFYNVPIDDANFQRTINASYAQPVDTLNLRPSAPLLSLLAMKDTESAGHQCQNEYAGITEYAKPEYAVINRLTPQK